MLPILNIHFFLFLNQTYFGRKCKYFTFGILLFKENFEFDTYNSYLRKWLFINLVKTESVKLWSSEWKLGIEKLNYFKVGVNAIPYNGYKSNTQ